MAQHSLKQRIQKDKLLQHSYYCIEEPMQSGGETGHHSRDLNTFIRTNKTGGGEKGCVQLCFDWMMLTAFQIVPKYDQYNAKTISYSRMIPTNN